MVRITGQLELSSFADGSAKWYNYYRKQIYLAFTYKVKTQLLSNNPTPGYVRF